MSGPPLPNFLIIGAQKSATRWLRDNLRTHPEIFMAPAEVEFFNHHFDRGEEWYRGHFDAWSGQPSVGEGTPGYLFHRDNPERTAARIEAVLGPDVRLIAVLRDPVARARSAFVHHLRRGRIDPGTDALGYLMETEPDADPLGLVSGGWYGASLAPYLDRFGEHHVHVEFHEDVCEQPGTTYRRTLEYLSVAADWCPPGLEQIRNSHTAALRASDPDHPVLHLARDELAAAIGHHFVEDCVHLQRLLSRPLPWPAPIGQGGGGTR